MPRSDSARAQRKPKPSKVSLDQAIKELLQLRPQDTLAFLLPDVVADRGPALSWQFHNVQVRKRDLTRKGLVMDLNIEYRFAEGTALLLVLVEHWSTARSVDLLRTAQYFLDLSSRFPEHEVVSVALITEIESPPVTGSFVRRALGQDVLNFSTRVVQLSQEDAAAWSGAANLVAATLLMAMGGSLARQDKLRAMIRFFQTQASETETTLLFPLLPEVGKLTNEEHAMTIKYLTQLPKPKFMVMMEEMALSEGMAKGMEQGMHVSKLESARKMLEHGIEWRIVTDVTGILPEDLSED